MFESPLKSNARNAWSESQEELSETEPVSPVSKGNRGKKKKKRRQQPQQQKTEKRSVSAPQLCAEESFDREDEQSEKRYTDYDEPIVRGIFQIGKKSHDVLLTSMRVTWSPIQPETPTGELTVSPLSMTIADGVCFFYQCRMPTNIAYIRRRGIIKHNIFTWRHS